MSRNFAKYYPHAKFQINWTIQTEITERWGEERGVRICHLSVIPICKKPGLFRVKPTNDHMYLLPQSSHHQSLYRNIPFGVALRLRRICSCDDWSDEQLQEFAVFPRFSAAGRLPIFEVFGGALTRAGALIITYENLDLPFPAHTRTLFIIHDN